MLFIIQFFQIYLKPLMLGIIGFFGLYLFKKNKDLEAKNLIADRSLIETKKVINVQNKIIEITKDTKPTDFDGNLERMHKNEL
jgi:hypothetical protein